MEDCTLIIESSLKRINELEEENNKLKLLNDTINQNHYNINMGHSNNAAVMDRIMATIN